MSYRITPGSTTPRLYFRWWNTNDTPKTDGTAAAIATAVYLRKSNGVWPTSGTSVGTLTDGSEGDTYGVGKVIRHASMDGYGNLYSIDPPTAATADGADAIRLLLTVDAGSVDVTISPLEYAVSMDYAEIVRVEIDGNSTQLAAISEAVGGTDSEAILAACTSAIVGAGVLRENQSYRWTNNSSAKYDDVTVTANS